MKTVAIFAISLLVFGFTVHAKDRLPGTSSLYPGQQLVVLLAGTDSLYAYTGGDMKNGKKYCFQELNAMLKTKQGEKDFMVLMRPSSKCSYKGTVNLLDLMKATGTTRYALLDISKEEETYLASIYPTVK